MKYIVFFFTLIFCVPTGFILSKRYALIEKTIYFLTVFLTCSLIGSINFVSREDYRGTSRGFEITLVDLLCLVLLFIVLSRKDKFKIKMFPPGTILYGLYFTFSCCSITNSGIALYSFFEVLKLFRMYLFYWVFYNYFQSFEQIKLLYSFVSVIIIYIFMVVIEQKYLLGIYQTPGPFPHQNSLVMYMNIFGSMMFAKVMNDKSLDFKRFLYYFMTFGMAGVCVVSTLSRGGMVCFALSIFIIFIVSYTEGFTLKKTAITVLIAMAVLFVLVESMDTIIQRFQKAPETSAETRVVLAEAAVKMAKAGFFGVGLNNFGLKINPPYPYGKFIKRTAWNKKEGIVETTYLLIAAETGWTNLVMYILFLLRFYFINLRSYFYYRKTQVVFVCIGLIGGLLAIYFESTLEWVLRQTNNSYQLMLVFAVIASLKKFRKQKFIYKFSEWN